MAPGRLPSRNIGTARLTSGLKIVDVIAESGLAVSKSAARRLIEQGAVRVGERKVESVEDVLRVDDLSAGGTLLHAGKKHLRRLVLEQ